MLISTKPFWNQKFSLHDNTSRSLNQKLIQVTVADCVVQMLQALGVRHAFGVGGGAIAPIWEALEKSSIEVLHFRHEVGAAFAAMEAYFANNRPVVVFTTTGPGITNALTGIAAARLEGAKLILISACTPLAKQGKWAFQETNINTMPEEIFTPGVLFNYAVRLKSGSELPEIGEAIALGLSKPGSFVAHISIPTSIQISTTCDLAVIKRDYIRPIPNKKVITKVVELLYQKPFAIWVGFGARDASEEILQLAEQTGAMVISSPRGKGIFPENHPQFVGVTGFAGHQSVLEYMQLMPPERILVLGTRLGEFTSFWNPIMIPKGGFIHVDIDPLIPGTAYPTANTFPIRADIKTFLGTLLENLPKKLGWSPAPVRLLHSINGNHQEKKQPYEGLVRPRVLMEKIQEVIVEGSNAIIIAEAGNSFAWTTHHLKFNQNKRWRVSTGFGAMGHASTGVVGVAIARRYCDDRVSRIDSSDSKAVAIVGDGAMLMNQEINTAVQYNIPAVWIVLNDASYNMCAQGTAKEGYTNVKTQIAPTDFVMLARSMGADGISVETESQLKAALSKAMASKVPFIIDVKINPTEPAPIGTRLSSLITQKAKLL